MNKQDATASSITEILRALGMLPNPTWNQASLAEPEPGFRWVLLPRVDVSPRDVRIERLAHFLNGRGHTWEGRPLVPTNFGRSIGGRVVANCDRDPVEDWLAWDPTGLTPAEAAARADDQLLARFASEPAPTAAATAAAIRALARAHGRRHGEKGGP